MKQNVTNDAWKDSPIDIIAPILPSLSFQQPRSQGSLPPMMATTGNAEVTYTLALRTEATTGNASSVRRLLTLAPSLETCDCSAAIARIPRNLFAFPRFMWLPNYK